MKTSHRITGTALLLALLTSLSALAEEASVLVKTEPLARHPLTDTLVGYGVVAPAAGHVQNLGTAHGGRVLTVRVSSGQVVRRGESLLDIETDPSANLAYRQAVTAVEFARGELHRVEALAAQRLATRSQVAAAKKALADAALRLREQERLGAGRRTATLRAPFDGVVTSLAVTPGERIAAGKTLLALARTDELRAQLGIEPEDALRVRPGMPVRIVSVFDERNAVAATVTRVQGMIDPQTQLVDAVVSFRNDAASRLLPGTRVRGDITVGSDAGWAVPRQAVLRDAQGGYLFQVKDGRARRVNVATGIESGGLIGVRGPLDPAQPVVILGNYELRDGMKVREQRP
jgi:membrane fusion protein (multidrug efflux system)